MKKYFLPIITLLALLCMPALARAGTCNASFADSLPQTSGMGGALPPSLPGQTSPGYITAMNATGGPGISFVYTPTVGAAVPFTVSFGTASGVSCTANQAGGWTGAKIWQLDVFNTFASPTMTFVINGSTQPMNVITCNGMHGYGNASLQFTSGSGNGLGMISTTEGSDPQNLTFWGYRASLGQNISLPLKMIGTCHSGPGTNLLGKDPLDFGTNQDNNAILDAYASAGATKVDFYVDGSSKGSDTTGTFDVDEYYYDLTLSGMSNGTHTVVALTTFPTGIVRESAPLFFTKRKVSAGDSFTCAINSDSRVKCWGYNLYGQGGTGSPGSIVTVPANVTSGNITPSPGPDLVRVTDLSAGLQSACAVYDGGIACWGRNTNGILGVSPATLPSSNTPRMIFPAGSGATKVGVGGNYACGLFNTGEVRCWGYGAFGQLGNGSNTSTVTTPTTSFFSNAQTLAVTRDATYVRTSTGEVWTFGRDNYGNLGDDATLANKSTPVRIFASGATKLWSSWYSGCALVSGTVKCWGSNGWGEAGDGNTVNAQPTPVTATSWMNSGTVVDLYGGDSTMCAILQPASAKCIGYNVFGQLGRNYTSGVPELVPTSITGFGTTGANHIAGGWTHMCAFHNNQIKCWGDNTYDEIDASGVNPVLTPTVVPYLF